MKTAIFAVICLWVGTLFGAHLPMPHGEIIAVALPIAAAGLGYGLEAWTVTSCLFDDDRRMP